MVNLRSMYRGLCFLILHACAPPATPPEPQPPPAPPEPPLPRSDGTTEIETAIAKRLELREGFMRRLAQIQQVWERVGNRCEERAVGFEPATKYAAVLGMPPPEPDA